MAKFEIYQSQLKTTEPKTPEIGALRLPFSIAHEQGAEIGRASCRERV